MNEASVKKYLRDVEYFTKKLEDDPKSRLFMPLAFAYLKLGKYDEAIDICSKGLDNHPEYHAAKTILANAFLEKGMIEEAKNLLYDIVEVSPDNYRANKMLGDILRNNGDLIGAAVYYRNALAIAPEDFELRVLIDELTESSNIKPFDMPSDIANLEEKLHDVEKSPADADLLDLKNELNQVETPIVLEDEIVAETSKKEVVVEIPDEGMSHGDTQLISSENMVIDKFDNTEKEKVEQAIEDDIKLDLNDIDFDFDNIVEEAKKKDDLKAETFETISGEIDGVADSTSVDETLQIGEMFDKDFDLSSLDISNSKSKVEEQLDLLDKVIVDSEPELHVTTDIGEQLSLLDELDIADKKESEEAIATTNISKDITFEDAPQYQDSNIISTENQRILEELELWLNNVKKLKETRNV